ncbi:MAG: UDP-glucose/GDP-mannose dehydrogenase family protein [Deltaproteobacteria bacterium]|nr:UDP-glucose/GDP-mannose dehydrogenase family protein [Deltaproteobacteria bacterium]
MKLCMIGTGYVGLVSGACLADAGNDVWCVDKDAGKIERILQGKLPIYEPGLEALVEHNTKEGRMLFTTSLEEALKQVDICFITVDTPPNAKGEADLTNVFAVAMQLGKSITRPLTVVTKSTVPVGTTKKVKAEIHARLRERGLKEDLLSVANNPEFLKEGDAVNDFMKPDRVVVGVECPETGKKLHDLYHPFMRRQERFFAMDIESSELTKYAANSMLATRISFMNELSRLCEKVGADINAVRLGLGSDPRIGPNFLYPGLGYGGSCFPKDMKALIHLGREHGAPVTIVESADLANDAQLEWYWQKSVAAMGGTDKLPGSRIAVWGISFKPETDDVRLAPALFYVRKFLEAGAEVHAYDPVAMENGKKALDGLGAQVKWHPTGYDCLKAADALLICTEWREFRSPDFAKMKSLMRRPLILDGRLLYESSELTPFGIKHISIGRRG